MTADTDEGVEGREQKQIQMEMLDRAYHSVMAAYLDREDYQKVLRGMQEGWTRAAARYKRRFSTPPSIDRSGTGDDAVGQTVREFIWEHLTQRDCLTSPLNMEDDVTFTIEHEEGSWWIECDVCHNVVRLAGTRRNRHGGAPTDRSGAEHKARVFTMPAPKSVQGKDYQARCSCGWKSGRFVTKSVVERKRKRHLEDATPGPDEGEETTDE